MTAQSEDSLVEVMARAIADAEWHSYDDLSVWEELPATWGEGDRRIQDKILAPHGPPQEEYIRVARAALTALRAQGYAVVPRDPTPLMLQAAHPASRNQSWPLNSSPDRENYEVWTRMLAAADEGLGKA